MTQPLDATDFTVSAALELKFAGDGGPDAGRFSGYGAVFGNVDAHGDVITPGAFATNLAERKATGRPIPMHVMHRTMGGDGLPVGVWTSVVEDQKGLRVDGKISGMNTDTGRLLFERVKDGALGGLSIGYRVRPGGVVYGKRAGEPKRTLKALDLHEISLVDEPSNPASRIHEVKSIASPFDIERILADAGVPRRAAAKIATAGFSALTKGAPYETDETDETDPDIERLAAVLRQQGHNLKTRSH